MSEKTIKCFIPDIEWSNNEQTFKKHIHWQLTSITDCELIEYMYNGVWCYEMSSKI